MSEFRFLCPECGQKILCETTLIGTQIACPTCQKTLTVPLATAMSAKQSAAAVGVASGSAPPLLQTTAQTAPQASPSDLGAVRAQSAERSRYSVLAIASLVSSVFVLFGFIPGIICGHMAKARMRKNVFLEGEKIADAGLIISYCVLAVTLVFGMAYLGVRWHFHPSRTVLQSADAVSAPAARVVDEVKIDETEEEHDLDGQMYSTTKTGAKVGRKTGRGGSFSYRMKVLPKESMSLICRYWGNEPKGRLFDIAIDDQVVATQELNHDEKDKFFDVEYKIPAALTSGKSKVTVEFQARPTWIAGTLYGCQMLKR